MKRVFLFLCAAVAVPAAVNAQMADAEIARAVAAAPARAQADATVISFGDDGSVVVLRHGSNGILCWDESSDQGFSATCTSEQNRARGAELRVQSFRWDFRRDPGHFRRCRAERHPRSVGVRYDL